MHPIDDRPPTSPYGVIRSRDGRVEEELAKGMAKLALRLLASGAIEPPTRPLDVPPYGARCRTQKK